MTMRPERLIVVTGTGTDIGKTWVTLRLALHLRRRSEALAIRKPAQSFEPSDPPEHTDAALLGAASGEAATDVCPPHRWYGAALAPPMAAAALGRPSFTIADLAAEVSGSWPAGTAVGLVEGAGGVASPQADDGDMRQLIAALDPDAVVVVADAALGTINLVRLSMEAIRGAGAWPLIVHCNRYDATCDLHRRNLDWLNEREGIDATTDIDVLAARVPEP
jgi:dethiobiotin synthetase